MRRRRRGGTVREQREGEKKRGEGTGSKWTLVRWDALFSKHLTPNARPGNSVETCFPWKVLPPPPVLPPPLYCQLKHGWCVICVPCFRDSNRPCAPQTSSWARRRASVLRGHQNAADEIRLWMEPQTVRSG